MNIEMFKQQFSYKLDHVGHVGVEREIFVTDWNGTIVPRAKDVLEMATCTRTAGNFWSGTPESWTPPKDWYGYELSACQVESRVGPVTLSELESELTDRSNDLDHWGFRTPYFRPLHTEIAPADMPLDVYPDPTGRYQKITQNMPRDVLLAACRVAGTHIHVGMRDHESALRTYNYVIRHTNELCEMGNGSFGERLAIYKQMAPDYEPRPYASWNEYYQYAVEKGFDTDPRKCWTLIRISVHGTLEFRMFGATESIDRIVSWATRCHELCQMAMAEA
jgi:gamma-glutamyl:cysteine ligase YbdK (ATP-grasp superfamily)